MEKIIIDTDPGVDDAIAITYAICAKLPIDALCTVFGNSTVENSTRNALSILELFNRNIPVYEGSPRPLIGKGILANSHGQDGLSGFEVITENIVSDISAHDYYRGILNSSDDIVIVAIGPSTNLGKLCQEDIELLKKAKKIILMGGVLNEPGNITEHAEFNVFNDPYALDLLLKANLPNFTLIPANVCRRVMFSSEVFTKIKDSELSYSLQKITKAYIDYYTKDKEYGGFRGGVMYDLLATVMVNHPEMFEYEKETIEVETNSKIHFGETRYTTGKSNVIMTTNVDENRIEKLFIETLNSY